MRIDYKRRPFIRRRIDYSQHYLINERIQAPSLRLLDDQGKQIGVLSRAEGLNLAREKGLDLVLITTQATPPVVKLINFNKFLYQEKKKQQEAKKGSKKSTVKDVKLSLFIDEGDFDRLVRKSQAFLKEGHQVRIGLLLRGRELGKKPMAFDLINQFIGAVGEVAVAHAPKFQGPVLSTVIGRKKS